MNRLKRWFSNRWPHHRICSGPWYCLLRQTYQHRCSKHQYWKNHDGLVLDVLVREPGLCGLDVAAQTGIDVDKIYPILARLEEIGQVTSEWVPGPYPRKRQYYIKNSS